MKTNEVLLFRVLPDGIHGRRLADCPRLDEEIGKLQGQVVLKGKRRCVSVDEDYSSKRQCTTPGNQTAVPSLTPRTPLRQRVFTPESVSPMRHSSTSFPLAARNSFFNSLRSVQRRSVTAPSLAKSSTLSQSSNLSRTLSSPGPLIDTDNEISLRIRPMLSVGKRANINSLFSIAETLEDTPDKPLSRPQSHSASLASSPSVVSGPSDQQTHKYQASVELFPNADPKARRHGERTWPGSYYAIDVISGFRKIDALKAQKTNTDFRLDITFPKVFGTKYVKSTYTKTRSIYDSNKDLIPIFEVLGRSSLGVWKLFANRSKDAIQSAQIVASKSSDGGQSSAIDAADSARSFTEPVTCRDGNSDNNNAEDGDGDGKEDGTDARQNLDNGEYRQNNIEAILGAHREDQVFNGTNRHCFSDL